MSDFDILVTNGIVMTLDEAGRCIENGAVAVKKDQIVKIGKRRDFTGQNAAETLDANGGIILPGLVNTHTHLPMSLFRGLADDLPLMEWLSDYMFPAEAAHIDPDTVQIGTLLSCAEMILSGTTTCCDGYFYEDQVAEAVRRAGMRAVLGQGVIDFPAPGVSDPADNIETAVDFVKKWTKKDTLVKPSIFCHSPYTCSENTLRAAKDAARRLGVLFQIHVAETKEEREESLRERKKTPVAYLEQIGLLDPDTLVVHGVWVDDADIAILKKNGAAVSHCPESNMKLGAGICPVSRLAEAGIFFGLGTDGCASNNNLDLFQEMDTAAKLQKASLKDPAVYNAEAVLKSATLNGARAIGLHEKIGSIEPGKQADLIVVDTKKPHLTPMYSPASALVYAAGGADVRDVMVAGRLLMKNRRLLTIDIEKVLEDANRVARDVKQGRGSK